MKADPKFRASRRLPDDLEPNRLSARIEAERAAGRDILDLTVSNPTQVGLNFPDAVTRAFASGEIGTYKPHPRGPARAREAVADLLCVSGGAADAEDVWLTAGTSEAYSFLFKLLCDPGERVAIPRPGYPLFEHLLALEGLEAVEYRLNWDKGRWIPDCDSLDQALRAPTRAAIVVQPNNPTGSLLAESEIRLLLADCRRRGIAVISDEVFLPFVLGTSPALSVRSLAGPKDVVFTLGGFSKQFGLPQIKISWVHFPSCSEASRLLAPRLDWIADMFLSVSSPVALIVPELAASARTMTAIIRLRIEESLRAVAKAVFQGPMELLSVEGGWTAVLRLPDDVDEESVAERLLENHGVLIHPGYFFDLPFESAFVVSLLAEPENLERGLDRAQAVIAEVCGSAPGRCPRRP